MLLTLGECRLFLTSNCLNSYPDIKSMLTGWASEGRVQVDPSLGFTIGKKERDEVVEYLNEEDCEFIRSALKEEWSGDNFSTRSYVKVRCDLCNKKSVRNCYYLHNKFTGAIAECGYTCYSKFIGSGLSKEELLTKERLSKDEIQKLAKGRLLKDVVQGRRM
ncbi:hypothetical protein [Bacillus phage SPO1L1]|nr:hypothetical protein [Bacillus phage SPO1L1]WIT26095.1 hypothetical protein [Bacillus phage SPO1L2]